MKIIVLGDGASALMLAQALLKLNHQPAILTSEDVAETDEIQEALETLDEMAEIEEKRSQRVICGLAHTTIAIRNYCDGIDPYVHFIERDFVQTLRDKPYYHGELRKKHQSSSFGKPSSKKPQKRFSRRYNHLHQR